MSCIEPHVQKLEVDQFENFITENLSVKPNEVSKMVGRSLEEVREDAEREAIRQALQFCKGNKSKAAKMLKISRPFLYQKMKSLGIEQDKHNW